jgi:23S rRNA (cytosine1962-C5)-methyltransferase
MITVRIDGRAGEALRAGHPWVYSNHVRAVEGEAQPGAVVRVVAGSGDDRDLGTAFYNPRSLVALRHLSFEGELPDRDLLARRLRAARALRERLYPEADAWRLCHGEADGLPGLVVDRYADVHVVQALSAGMDAVLEDVAAVLCEEHGARSVVERDESHLRALEGLPERRRVLAGPAPEPVVVSVPPLRLEVDVLAGQKTGAFLDQRENRVAAARLARGCAVYDGFCNAGAFGIEALVAGAESVVAVDSSAQAAGAARRNAERNGVAERHLAVQADAGDDMEARHRRRERFGLVLIDPPSFTRSRKHVPQARRELLALNRRALTLVAPGGFLVTSCCSYHVREETFLEVVREAGAQAMRRLRLLEARSQSPDHPTLLAVPESRYLKCLVLQVGGWP